MKRTIGPNLRDQAFGQDTSITPGPHGNFRGQARLCATGRNVEWRLTGFSGRRRTPPAFFSRGIPTMAEKRFAAAALIAFATSLLERAGVRTTSRADVADVLVTADLLGHTTHGLALLAPYLAEIESGTMANRASPTIVSDRPAAQTWDGSRLPGPWLTLRALDAAATMAASDGTGTVVIRRSHHIACLAVYLLRATERGLVAIVQSSDPIVAAVVPHGGTTPVITPNPIAAGLPTSGDPILIDISSSITSMGFAKQEMQAGRKLPGAWLIDHEGNATDDPGALFAEPKGALLPLGGLDAGYKGFGLALLIEALTAGLRATVAPTRPRAGAARCSCRCSTPRPSAGLAAFKRQMDHWSPPATTRSRAPACRACGCRARPACSAARAARARRRALSDDHAGARAVGGEARRRGARFVTARPVEFALLLVLATLWGASFTFIKVGVETIPPVTLIAGRTTIAASCCSRSCAIAASRCRRISRSGAASCSRRASTACSRSR